MKKQYLLLFAIITVILAGCSSSQNLGTTSMPDAKVEEPKVAVKTKAEKSEKTKTSATTTAAKTTTATATASKSTTKNESSPSTNVVVREERFNVVEEPGVAVEAGKYYVIIGSFKMIDNAKKYKSQLIIDGLNPTLLQNENGLYRVAAGVFMQEMPARDKIASIRSQFSKYDDVWLLIKKE